MTSFGSRFGRGKRKRVDHGVVTLQRLGRDWTNSSDRTVGTHLGLQFKAVLTDTF